MDTYPRSSGTVQVIMENSAKIGRIFFNLTGAVCINLHTPHMLRASLVGDYCDPSASANL